MAVLIPNNLPSRSDVPASVIDVAKALRDFLPDEVIVWLEWTGEGEKEALRRELGEQRLEGLEPDVAGRPFLVVLDPEAGIVVMEVPTRLRGRRGSPRNAKIDRAHIRDLISQRVSELEDEISASALEVLPVAAARAVPNLPGSSMGDAPQVELLKADDFTAENLRFALHAILGGRRRSLSESEVSAARAAVNPDIIIKGSQNQLFSPEENKEILRTLDLKQEHLAEHLGSGYRMIRGVAGSGKTLVLTHRARHIARNFPQWSVLLLCFNKALSLGLKKQVQRYKNVHVKTLDAYAKDVVERSGLVPAKTINNGPNFGQIRRDAYKELQRSSDDERYDMVLVDEAQDFDEEALDLAWASLKNGKEHFVLALDGTQRIYGSARRRRVTWNPPGLTAQGRTTILVRNYRNTRQILDQGWVLITSLLGKDSGSRPDDLDVLVQPGEALRNGLPPLCLVCGDVRSEAEAIVRRVAELRLAGAAPHQIAVLVGNRDVRDRVLRFLDDALDTNDWRQLDAMFNLEHEDKIVVATLGRLKGLEYKHVIIGGANHIDIPGNDGEPNVDDQRRLLYVAITRATETLTITYSGDGIMSGLTNVPEFTR